MNDYIDSKIQWPGWEVVRVIGRGSFGAVYEIRRDVFGRTERAALKVITIPQSDSDIEELYNDGYDEESVTRRYRSYLEDIAREYSLMAEMKGHTNVVYCDDLRYVQHEDGIGWDIYIKMELLTPLTKYLGRDASQAQIVKLGMDICNALVLCKSRNIVHRDIKPQNIFASQDGNFKLGDFGIAKTAERTTSGTKIGTYKYMAPEVYNNRPYGASADIYSLGLVLYWLLNERRTPFLPLDRVPSASEEDAARKRRFEGEPLPAPKNGSEELKRIVLRACAYDPKDRFASAEEMLAALSALAGAPSVPLSVSASETKTLPEPVPESLEEDGFGPTVGPGREPEPRHEPAPAPEPSEPPVEADPGPTVGPESKPQEKSPARLSQSEPAKQTRLKNPDQKRSQWMRWVLGIAIFAFAVILLVLLFVLKGCGGKTSVDGNAAVSAPPVSTPVQQVEEPESEAEEDSAEEDSTENESPATSDYTLFASYPFEILDNQTLAVAYSSVDEISDVYVADAFGNAVGPDAVEIRYSEGKLLFTAKEPGIYDLSFTKNGEERGCMICYGKIGEMYLQTERAWYGNFSPGYYEGYTTDIYEGVYNYLSVSDDNRIIISKEPADGSWTITERHMVYDDSYVAEKENGTLGLTNDPVEALVLHCDTYVQLIWEHKAYLRNVFSGESENGEYYLAHSDNGTVYLSTTFDENCLW